MGWLQWLLWILAALGGIAALYSKLQQIIEEWPRIDITHAICEYEASTKKRRGTITVTAYIAVVHAGGPTLRITRAYWNGVRSFYLMPAKQGFDTKLSDGDATMLILKFAVPAGKVAIFEDRSITGKLGLRGTRWYRRTIRCQAWPPGKIDLALSDQ